MRWRGRMDALVAVALVLVVAACGSAGPSEFSDSAPFGSNDVQCSSATLRNEADDRQVLAAALDCFFAEYEAGRPVTIDLDTPTVEGDSIYIRYRYDGTSVLIVEDSRADEFGIGVVRARQCATIQRPNGFPEGVDCSDVDHPGFPEANQ